jgi:peptidoglycan/LPS O-acetylase OafA/YrhL
LPLGSPVPPNAGVGITGAPSPRPGHVAALDGVRGVAILLVVVHTFAGVARDGGGFGVELIRALALPGWSGVQLFFVLSGFLITGVLLDGLGSPSFFRTFYVRRVLRIFPLYYSVLVVALLVVPHLGRFPTWSAAALAHPWWYWTYTSNWANPFGIGIVGLSHFWSLAVEEQFYLLWPVIVFVMARRRLVIVCAAVIAATPLVRLALIVGGFPPLAAYEFTIARWDALAAGALLTMLLRDASGRRWLSLWMPIVARVSLAALIAVLLLAHGFGPSMPPVAVVGQSVVAALSAWMIYLVAAPGTALADRAQRAMSADWLRSLGKYSYAIYVFHLPIHVAGDAILGDAINSGSPGVRAVRLVSYLAGAFGLSVVAAIISWRVLEKPCLDLKERLAPRTGPVTRPLPHVVPLPPQPSMR